MFVLGLILCVFVLAFLCWLLFNLAVYALPCFLGMTVGVWSYHHQSGLLGAMLIAVLAAAITLGLGQLAFAHLRAPLARISIALLFAIPAGIAGYHAALGFARMTGAGPGWCNTVAILGALMVGCTAFARIAAFACAAVAPRTVAPSDRLAAQG
jgi:hypothetical protein